MKIRQTSLHAQMLCAFHPKHLASGRLGDGFGNRIFEEKLLAIPHTPHIGPKPNGPTHSITNSPTHDDIAMTDIAMPDVATGETSRREDGVLPRQVRAGRRRARQDVPQRGQVHGGLALAAGGRRLLGRELRGRREGLLRVEGRDGQVGEHDQGRAQLHHRLAADPRAGRGGRAQVPDRGGECPMRVPCVSRACPKHVPRMSQACQARDAIDTMEPAMLYEQIGHYYATKLCFGGSYTLCASTSQHSASTSQHFGGSYTLCALRASSPAGPFAPPERPTCESIPVCAWAGTRARKTRR